MRNMYHKKTIHIHEVRTLVLPLRRGQKLNLFSGFQRCQSGLFESIRTLLMVPNYYLFDKLVEP